MIKGMIEPRILISLQDYLNAGKQFRLKITCKVHSQNELQIEIIQPWHYWFIPYPVIAKRRKDFIAYVQTMKPVSIFVWIE